jgi:hypothetical protein
METDNYFDLTPKIPKYSITALYLKKLKEGVITYQKNRDGFSVTQLRLNRKDLNTNLPTDTLNLKSLFNERFYGIPREQISSLKSNCLCDTCTHPVLLDIIKVKQIVYYKNGRFHINNVLLTPMCLKDSIDYENDSSVWYDLFNVGFSNKTDLSPSSKMIYIGTTENSYNFSVQKSKLITLRNPGIMKLIYADFKKGLFYAYSPDDTSRKVKLKDLLVRAKKEFMIQDYDSLGNIIGTRKVMSELNLDSFYNFKIAQDIYFDPVTEVLISIIKSVSIQAPVITSTGVNLGLGDLAIIYYDEKRSDKKPPSVKKKSVSK